MARNEKLDLLNNLKMEDYTKVNGLKMKKMVWESTFGLMEQDMMDIGKMESVMVKEDVFMLTATYMKVNGFKIKSKVMVSKDRQMEDFIKESGLMINKKERETEHGLMVIVM